jgi:hypothetical protein
MALETLNSGFEAEHLAHLPKMQYIGARLMGDQLMILNSGGILRGINPASPDAHFEIDLDVQSVDTAKMDLLGKHLLVSVNNDLRVVNLDTEALWTLQDYRYRQNIVGSHFTPDGSVITVERRLTENLPHEGFYTIAHYSPIYLTEKATHSIGYASHHWVTQIEVSNNKLIVNDYKTLRIFSMSGIEEESISTGEDRVIFRFAVSPDGKFVMICTQSDQRYIKILNLESLEVIKSILQKRRGDLDNPTWAGNSTILWSNDDGEILQSTIDPETPTYFTYSGSGLASPIISMDVDQPNQRIIVLNSLGDISSIPLLKTEEGIS